MKTPEELAEEFINHVLESQCDCSYRIAFLAGYQAAKDHYFQMIQDLQQTVFELKQELKIEL